MYTVCAAGRSRSIFVHVYSFVYIHLRLHFFDSLHLFYLLLITPIVHLINCPLQPHLRTCVPCLVQEQGEGDVSSRESVLVPSTDMGTPAENPLNWRTGCRRPSPPRSPPPLIPQQRLRSSSKACSRSKTEKTVLSTPVFFGWTGPPRD